MRGLFYVIGAFLLPGLLIAGIGLVIVGCADHRDELAIAGAIMLGSAAIAGHLGGASKNH